MLICYKIKTCLLGQEHEFKESLRRVLFFSQGERFPEDPVQIWQNGEWLFFKNTWNTFSSLTTCLTSAVSTFHSVPCV